MLRKSIYIAICLLAGLIYTRQQLELPLADWVNNYVNDFLVLPIVLGVTTYIVRWLKKDLNYRFSLLFIACLATYYALFFEYVLPKFSSRYTGDWVDVLLYFLGGLAYYLAETYRPSSQT